METKYYHYLLKAYPRNIRFGKKIRKIHGIAIADMTRRMWDYAERNPEFVQTLIQEQPK